MFLHVVIQGIAGIIEINVQSICVSVIMITCEQNCYINYATIVLISVLGNAN